MYSNVFAALCSAVKSCCKVFQAGNEGGKTVGKLQVRANHNYTSTSLSSHGSVNWNQSLLKYRIYSLRQGLTRERNNLTCAHDSALSLHASSAAALLGAGNPCWKVRCCCTPLELCMHIIINVYCNCKSIFFDLRTSRKSPKSTCFAQSREYRLRRV